MKFLYLIEMNYINHNLQLLIYRYLHELNILESLLDIKKWTEYEWVGDEMTCMINGYPKPCGMGSALYVTHHRYYKEGVWASCIGSDNINKINRPGSCGQLSKNY